VGWAGAKKGFWSSLTPPNPVQRKFGLVGKGFTALLDLKLR